MMQKRKLGNSGLEIAPLMFGGNVFGWTADEAMSFKLLDGFVGAGLNAIDTADVYSKWVPGHKGGESETVVGNWLKARGSRDKVVIATKVGLEMPGIGQGLRRDYILQRVEDSLKRLQTDYIDLYQSHTDDKDAPLDETLAAYDQLMKQGKVRAIGASNYDAPRLAEALDVSAANKLPRYETLQPHYNLYERADYERALEPLVLKQGIGVIPYYSLASGFLTGKYRSEADFKKSPRGGGAKKMLNERGLRILKGLDDVSARLKANPAQVALAWLIARPSITAPIASATNLEQLKDLIAATRLKLDADAIKVLDAASR
jgi:aryl-alcohol dehydrogenase-like predicted oxidoreductase